MTIPNRAPIDLFDEDAYYRRECQRTAAVVENDHLKREKELLFQMIDSFWGRATAIDQRLLAEVVLTKRKDNSHHIVEIEVTPDGDIVGTGFDEPRKGFASIQEVLDTLITFEES